MIPLFKPYMPEELPELDTVLHSGALAYGSYAKSFETALQTYFGTPYIIAANSFQLAICVMLTAFGIKPGDEIIASPMGCLVSTQPYASFGLDVVWADVSPETGTLDPASVREKLSGRTKLIVHNHFCGFPGYIDEIVQIGREYGVPVVDDGIECFGSLYKGRKIGSCGADAAVFSFGAVRLPSTIEGGAMIFRDQKTYEKALLICDNGIDRAHFRDADGEIDPACDISLRGYNAKMSNVNGYIGLCQMRQVDGLLGRQRANAARWREAPLISGVRELPLTAPDNVPNYWVYGLLADDKKRAIREFRERGYYASGVHINNNIYSVFGSKTELAGAQYFQDHFVAVPCGWWM